MLDSNHHQHHVVELGCLPQPIAATSAYVEITFDNSSGRVPIEGDDVTLRRAIGAKKDEFFVQWRRVTKREVEGLLEGCKWNLKRGNKWADCPAYVWNLLI